MEEEKKVSETQTDGEGKDPVAEPSHESKKPERTEKEKAEFFLKKKAEELRNLGGSPEETLGIKPNLEVDEDLSDDTPLTVGSLRAIQKKESKKTALQLADAIEDELERNEVKSILKDRLIPSLNPNADVELVRAAVNAKRTTQIAQDINRKTKPNRTALGGSVPGKVEEEFTPTEQEAIFMARPYNMSKEKILAARKRAEEKER